MEVEIIYKEIIKPSSSSSSSISDPKIFKHSLLAQLIPSRYAPLVLFYPMEKDTTFDLSSRLNLLKSSLCATLADFYPLAGKIRDDFSIDCNDEGVCFIETRVNCTLEEFLTKPDLLSINSFLPCEFVSDESLVGTFATNVQANLFECDGIAVGICISHKLLDGDGLRMFLKRWTSSNKSEQPDFAGTGAVSVFPAEDLWLRDSSNVMWGSFLKKGTCETKRFVFDASSIAMLKYEAIESGVKCPTRVEVVSAILWKSLVAASEKLNGFQRPSLLNHLVNLRRRMEPSLVENVLGNFLWVAPTEHDDPTEPEFEDLVEKVREAIARVDCEFVGKMRGEQGKNVMLKSLVKVSDFGSEKVVDYFSFSSWCNFRYYDVANFGWGKPIWVSIIGLGGSIFFNLIILADTRCGQGVEAWVTLDEQNMAILERNGDIIRLTSLDPSPLS